MTIGEKIKNCRVAQKKTQSELAGDRITRNMLSAIESGKATPSLDTLRYLAEALGISVSYFCDEDADLAFCRKAGSIARIRAAFAAGKYREAVADAEKLLPYDDEIAYILCLSYFALGKAALVSGTLQTALSYFAKAEDASAATIYDVEKVRQFLPFYRTVCRTPETPLFSLDEMRFRGDTLYTEDLEFAMYVFQDPSFGYKRVALSEHLKAKSLIRNNRYLDAIAALQKIVDERHDGFENGYVMFSVYSDLETCYREIRDFESAYRYASKRLSLLQAFAT